MSIPLSKMDLVEIFKKRTRHPFRPRASDVIAHLFPDFEPIKPTGVSLVAGTCEFLNKRLYVIGQQKPKPSDLKNEEDLKRLNYGMLTADDHSQILSILKKAKASDPDKTFIAGPRVMKSSGFEVDEKLIRSDYLHELSAGVYDALPYYHDIRGIQEICERKNMKLAIAKYLELYKRTNYRPKKKSRKKGGKAL